MPGRASSSRLATLVLLSLVALASCIVLLRPFQPFAETSNRLLIALACRASSAPEACESSLSLTLFALQDDGSPARLVSIAVALAHRRTQTCHSLSQTALAWRTNGNLDLAAAIRRCEYLLRRASHLLRNCSILCDGSPHVLDYRNAFEYGRMKDMEAWMSAALTWENDCFSALGHVNRRKSRNTSSDLGFGSSSNKVTNMFSGHNLHASQHSELLSTHKPGSLEVEAYNRSNAGDLIDHLVQCVQITVVCTSNALGLLDAYDTYGANVSAWRLPSKRMLPGSHIYQKKPQEERFNQDVERLIPTVTVSIYGHGMYTSIQEAVDNAPEYSSERYVIYIEQGIYNETVRVPYTKPSLTFFGDGMGKTVITSNLHVQLLGLSTYDTATLAVDGDSFIAYHLTVENTAHRDMHQAVALRVSSDRSAFYFCSFLGHQDTLYAHSLRHYYHSCRIEGTIDFIFGNSASVFKGCELLIRPGRILSSVIAAHGRTDAAQTSGFVFEDCIINGTSEFMERFILRPKKYKVYLGRPWKEYSRIIYKNTQIERVVCPQGWRPWQGDFALGTLFYGEFNNTGVGADFKDRVKWVEQMSSSLVSLYTISNFIQGDKWLLDDV